MKEKEKERRKAHLNEIRVAATCVKQRRMQKLSSNAPRGHVEEKTKRRSNKKDLPSTVVIAFSNWDKGCFLAPKKQEEGKMTHSCEYLLRFGRNLAESLSEVINRLGTDRLK